MRHFILHGLVMLFTFASGFGLERLIQYNRTPVAKLPAEQKVVPVPAASVVPAATIAAEPSAMPGETLILDYDRKRIVRYGIFYIYGRAPREFADVQSIELDLIGAEPPYDGYIFINTYSAPDRNDGAGATFALVTERRLFFVTSSTRESKVEYRFDGEFLTKDLKSMQGKNAPALRGTLTKTRNGRTIAERVISFRVDHMGC